MANPFLGQIEMFASNFAPRGWAFCNGQLLAIAQNSALFALLGTTYGGDGRTTFGLPDLRGRAPLHSGNGNAGPGLSRHPLGQRTGLQTNTLHVNQLPYHSHSIYHSGELPTGAIRTGDTSGNPTDSPVGAYPTTLSADFGGEAVTSQGYSTTAPNSIMAADCIDINLNGVTTATGGSQPLHNMQPYLAVNFIIAMVGTFPSRN